MQYGRVILETWNMRSVLTGLAIGGIMGFCVTGIVGTASSAGEPFNPYRASFENSLEEQLTLEAKLQGKCGQTRDFKEGVIAFLDKRPAEFEGR